MVRKVNGVVTHRFLWQSDLRIAAEVDSTGQVLTRYVYGTQINVPDLMIRDGATCRILHDHLGSPRLVVDTATGAIARRMDFDEWGNVTLDTNPNFHPFGFAGGLDDSDTGLTRFGARDYDPTVGRWTAKDPIGFGARSPMLYQYLGADPTRAVDPLGLAQLCHRALSFDPGGVVYSHFGRFRDNDATNTAARHEQFWFDDGRNFGYFRDGVHPDYGARRDDYRCDWRHFDDTLLREAIRNTRRQEGGYRLYGSNCQDWTEDVIAEYERLRREHVNSTGIDPELEFVWQRSLGN